MAAAQQAKAARVVLKQEADAEIKMEEPDPAGLAEEERESAAPPRAKRSRGEAGPKVKEEPVEEEAVAPPPPEEGPSGSWDARLQEFLKTLQAPGAEGESPPLPALRPPWDGPKASQQAAAAADAAHKWPQGLWVPPIQPPIQPHLIGEDGQGREIHLESVPGAKGQEGIFDGGAASVEKQRQRFRSLRYQEAGRPWELCRQLRDLCRQWLRPERHTKEQMLELVTLEQFLALLPPDMQNWVRANRPETCAQAVTLAEGFLLQQREAKGWDPQTAYNKAHMSAEEALDLYFQSDSESDGFVSGDEEGAPYVGSCSEQEDFIPSEPSSSSSTDEEQPAEMAPRPRAGDTTSSGATGRRCGRKGGQCADRLASFPPDPAQGEHHGGATILKGRNGRTWHTAPQPVHRRIARDILREYPGPKRAAKKDTISETFELLLTEPILCLLIYETNREAERVTREWNQSNPTKIRHWKYLDVTELKAYIGLLLLAGLYRGHHETLEELWDSVSGRTFFRATMSLRRFSDITRFLRFDNKATRDSRRASDKLAAFRDVWAMFVEQLSKWYTPGADLTVDEQLVEFRGRCPFKQYIPNKPGKYGIKVWWCCDAGTAYPLMGEVYLGKRPGAPREAQLGLGVATRVVEPYFHTGRNVVGSTFFTSIELAEELISKDLTYVGTLKRNKPYIPPEMQPHPCRKPLSSLFAFDGDYTLVSYVPKKGKAVLLLSSMHHASKVHGEFKKPDILSHYNATKSGVHTLDHLVRNYTCKRKINRWPMVLFFNMLDVAALASYVLWVHTHPQWENRVPRQRRRLFITALGKELIRLEVQRRMEDTPNLSASIRSAAHALGCVQQPVPPPVQPSVSKGRCHFCARAVDKKTTRWCSSCGKFVCKEHCITKVKCCLCQ